MAKEGIPFILIFLFPALAAAIFASAFGGWWLWSLTCLFVLLVLFMAYFFRDPERHPPEGEDIVVAPADGRVLIVERIDESDPLSPTQISIFLSPLDVHINRSPIQGRIDDVVYKPGEFKVASRRIASEVNEQNVISMSNGQFSLVARQIAGLLARRIVCWKKAGDAVALGERIGLMKFSSRMDIVVPPEIAVLCSKGDRVVAGETIIGRKAL